MIRHSTNTTPLTFSRVLWISGILCFCLFLVACAALMMGTAEVSWSKFMALVSGTLPADDPVRLIVLKIRLPRILLAALVGFSLSMGGVVFQALLRNPLADPFILGVSSGAAFGAILGIFFGFTFTLGIPSMAFAGALFTVYLVLAIGSRRMGIESSTILLTGVIVNAFFTAMIMFFISVAADSRLHAMLYWLYGDLSQGRAGPLVFLAPFLAFAFAVLFGYAKHLNLLTAGEETAFQLGVNVERTKKACLLIVSLMIGLTVSFSGLIGFVGLILPHLARMLFGADHRLLLPAASLGGAVFLIAADTLARTIISPSELPVGVITAFLGAPFFIYLLKSRGSQWSRS